VDPKDRIPAEWPILDLSEMLKRLTAEGVDFVVIGGIAVVASGYVRMTRDLDIAFAGDARNLNALGEMLTGVDARLRGLDEEVPFVADARTLAGIQLLTLETSLGWLDVHRLVPGVESYEKLRERAVTIDVEGASVLVASVEDLLAMKRAAGRPQDHLDIEALESIKRLREEGDGTNG
jgi:predicted nucleotidyltransferase